MKKIKYQGGLTKLLASEIGKKNKKRFGRFAETNLSSLVSGMTSAPVGMDVVSFSSGRDFYDQILSILSFLRYVGTPVIWTIYSDGSHTAQQIGLLKTSFDFIDVRESGQAGAESFEGICKKALLPYKDQLLDYARLFPLGKKLFYYLNHAILRPTLFLDSDILFYEKASVFNFILKEKVAGWYLPEAEWGCLDSRYKRKFTGQLYQANSGCFLLNKELADVSEGLDFLKDINFEYEYFSEQSVFHIIFRSNGFMPLDPRIFILSSKDQFDFSYLYSKEEMAIRHYTGPVRHKMWQRDWKWQLSILN